MTISTGRRSTSIRTGWTWLVAWVAATLLAGSVVAGEVPAISSVQEPLSIRGVITLSGGAAGETVTAPVGAPIRIGYDMEAAARSAAEFERITATVPGRFELLLDSKGIGSTVATGQVRNMDWPTGFPQKLTLSGQLVVSVPEAAAGLDLLARAFGETHFLTLVDRQTGLQSAPLQIRLVGTSMDRLAIFGVPAIAVGLLGLVVAVYMRKRMRAAMLEDLRETRDSLLLETSRLESFANVPRAVRPPLPLPAPPNDLAKALAGREAVLVLGGGGAAQAGFPTSIALVDELLKKFGGELSPSLAPDGDARARWTALGGSGYARTIDAILSKVPRHIVAGVIGDILRRVKPFGEFHQALAALPWRGVVSFTWDGFTETAFVGGPGERDSGWRVFTPEDASELTTALRRGDKLFLRPLGDLEKPSTLSLSMEELRRHLPRWPEFRRQLALLLHTQRFLFVGVGADSLEQFLNAVAYDAEIPPGRHWALVPDSADVELLGSSLSRFGIVLLPYTDDPRHQALPDFAAALAAAAGRLPAMSRARPVRRIEELAASRINGVRLTNVSLFDSLDLSFSTADADGAARAAPWSVIFGANGCGKSSILRAVGLALCGNEASAAAGRLLQAGKPDGLIELTIGEQAFRTRLIRNRNDVIVEAGATTPVQAGLCLILGFPALRGGPSANPLGPATIEAPPAEPADLMPLVDGDVDERLRHFKQWLVNLLEQAGRGYPRAAAIRSLLDAIVRDMVPGRFRRFAPLDDTYVIRVKIDDGDGPSPDDVPFDQISQGMTSIFHWVGALIQRLYDFYPDEDRPEACPAIVLIDEIDAHLHPDWQRRLVELTRKFFPRVQVIATSHSPLLAGALRGYELCLLENDAATGAIRQIPSPIDPYGMRAEQILTSAVFRLASDRNLDLEQRIRRHVELAETLQPSEPEKAEFEALTQELKAFGYAGAEPRRPVRQPTKAELDKLREALAKMAEAERAAGAQP